MQMITRKLYQYHITASKLEVDAKAKQSNFRMYGECEAFDTSMTKTRARAALAKATGVSVPKGLVIEWEPTGSVTYGLPLDRFLEEAQVVATDISEA